MYQLRYAWLILLTVLLGCAAIPVASAHHGARRAADLPACVTHITDAAGLQDMALDLHGAYCLDSDIVLPSPGPGAGNFTPIGIFASPFSGTLDGQGHTITNLTIVDSGDYAGLFGSLQHASVANLGLIGGTVSAAGWVGGLAGTDNYSTLANVYNTGSVSGGSEVGGLVGFALDGSIGNASSTGAVLGGTNSQEVGGLVGATLTTTLSNVYSTGSVTVGAGSELVGGLVGDSGSVISDAYSTGTVVAGAGSAYLGGLLGKNVDGTISQVYSTGSVSTGPGSVNVGGLVGYNVFRISDAYSTGAVTAGANSSVVGGLVGYNAYLVHNTYSIGAVSAGQGSSGVGALIGVDHQFVIDSFWDADTAGQSRSAGGFGEPASALQSLSFFQSPGLQPSQLWDFESTTPIWAMVDAATVPAGCASFPYLYWRFPTDPRPTIAAPGGVATLTSGSIVFTGPNQLSVADAQPGVGTLTVALSVGHGTLSLGSSSGLVRVSGADGSAAFSVSGAIATLNTDLATLTYTPASGFSGPDALTLQVDDGGGSEAGFPFVACSAVPLMQEAQTYVVTAQLAARSNRHVLFLELLRVSVGGQRQPNLVTWTTNRAQFSATGAAVDPVTQVSTAGSDTQATITGIISRAIAGGGPFQPGDRFAVTVHTGGGQPWFRVRDLATGYDVTVQPASGQVPSIS